jgi:transcriptional regulator with XRE-family HTH domain
MTELPLNQRDLAERSGVSVATIRELQYPSTPRRRSARTLGAISEALEWPEGYLRAVLRGEAAPTGGTPAKPSGDLGLVLSRLDELQGEVRRLADAVEHLTTDGAASPER